MQNDKLYLVCNLKANKTKNEIIEYEKDLQQIPYNSNLELIICPSTPFLYLFQNDIYQLGSQDISKFNSGAHTGESTAEQLSSLNVKYALIGHSERRKLFKEEEKTIIEKIKKAYHSHIRPIYFIGESKDQRDYQLTEIVLKKQICHIIDEVPDYKREKMIIVYEPIWAVGSGFIPSNEEIKNTIETIKTMIKEKYALTLPVLYGGSVNKDNVEELQKIENLDGFVLGDSSLEIQSLLEVCAKLKKCRAIDKNKHNTIVD